MTKKVFLVSHSKFAEGIKGAVEMIAGKQDNLHAFCLMENNSPNKLIEKIRDEIAEEDQVILLADITGGSMYNEAMSLLVLPNVRVIGGMNLSLLLNIVLADNISDNEMDKMIQDARDGITRAQLQKTIQLDDFFI
ncbi:PTS sugar transporter subunit IIA [Niallia sp. JL1B1071]|uniref:PTS sugar transporter subunit IIA n=1 Tax=Niallia tiangongensis TaxID=3237105 RepID=UPI0037DCEBF6